ncbi:hypothetical protein AgCh_039085 [Apium graveolens]
MLDISVHEKHKSKQGHVLPVEHGSLKVNVVTIGQKRKDCPSKKAKKAGVVAQANTMLGLGNTSESVANMVIGEVVASGTDDGFVTYNPVLLSTYLSHEWLIDTGANVHICADISLFVSYQQCHGVTVTMGNASAAQVLRIGNVDLQFAFGRILSLTRVHHVLSIRRNIISGSCLVKKGFQLSLKCNKVVITHIGTFFSKGYLSDESSDLWHLRLGHLNFGALKNMMNLELIPKYAIDKKSKCQDEALNKFIMYKNEAETQTGKVLKRLRSDKGDGNVVNTIFEFHDATFFEEVFPMKTGIPLGSSEDDPTHTSSSIPDHVEKMTNVGVDPVEEPRRSKRAKVVKDFGSDFITYNVEDEPLTFHQAMDSSESRHWKGTVKSEIDSIVLNETWELVDLPPGYSTIGCKWIFKRNLNSDGSIDKYKARLVAKGFRQMEGIDYFDTYSLVARMTTIRMLIALASVHDDILLFGTNIEIINKTKSFLKRHFEMKDMGEASVILGIKLTQSTDRITLSQSHYIEKSILEKPDISYSVSKLARYTSCPNKTHWEALDRVPRYLKGTISLGLHYRRFLGVLEGYSDASWIAKKYGSNRVTGCVFTLAGGAVSWKSSRQTLITRSTFEAELCALDATGTEAEWLHGLMSMLPVVSKPLLANFVYCDSRTTIDKVRSVNYNAKTKRHIQVRLKSVRGLVSDRIIAIEFIGTQDNIADPLNKGLEHAGLRLEAQDLMNYSTGSSSCDDPIFDDLDSEFRRVKVDSPSNHYDYKLDLVSQLELKPIITKLDKVDQGIKPAIKFQGSSRKFEEKSSCSLNKDSIGEEKKCPVRKLRVKSIGVKLRAKTPRIASKRLAQVKGQESVSSHSRLMSVAIVKESIDPDRDFKESMMGMIMEHNMSTKEEFQQLLACYLSLNPGTYRELIVKVFEQILFEITGNQVLVPK